MCCCYVLLCIVAVMYCYVLLLLFIVVVEDCRKTLHVTSAVSSSGSAQQSAAVHVVITTPQQSDELISDELLQLCSGQFDTEPSLDDVTTDNARVESRESASRGELRSVATDSLVFISCLLFTLIVRYLR